MICCWYCQKGTGPLSCMVWAVLAGPHTDAAWDRHGDRAVCSLLPLNWSTTPFLEKPGRGTRLQFIYENPAFRCPTVHADPQIQRKAHSAYLLWCTHCDRWFTFYYNYCRISEIDGCFSSGAQPKFLRGFEKTVELETYLKMLNYQKASNSIKYLDILESIDCSQLLTVQPTIKSLVAMPCQSLFSLTCFMN